MLMHWFSNVYPNSRKIQCKTKSGTPGGIGTIRECSLWTATWSNMGLIRDLISYLPLCAGYVSYGPFFLHNSYLQCWTFLQAILEKRIPVTSWHTKCLKLWKKENRQWWLLHVSYFQLFEMIFASSITFQEEVGITRGKDICLHLG